jgi:hypothetical protein
MRDGWWANWKTGKLVAIHEHERDIRMPAVATQLGVPDDVFRRFGRYVPERDRCRFLFWLMSRLPLMRIRRHTLQVTFEYVARSDRKPLEAVAKWAGRHAGPATLLNITNLKTGRQRREFAALFLDRRRKRVRR